MSSPVLFGISMVRNEADIVRTNILHHLSLGLDRVLIIDNGSSDGTDTVLEELSKDPRVRWTRDDSPYRQSQMLTRLARQASAEGADWVLPFDADEFWYAPRRTIKQVLAQSEAVAIRAQLVNFVQRRGQLQSSPDALLHMTRRIPRPIGPLELAPKLIETQKIAYIEARYPPKWLSRALPTLEISAGNHFVSGLVGGLEDTNEIVCLHAPLRSRARLAAKASQGKRVEAAGHKQGESWHLRRFSRLEDESRLDTEWAANSYRGNHLDVYGEAHPAVFDSTLRDLLMVFLADTPWRRLQALWRRTMLRHKRWQTLAPIDYQVSE
jgi:glycosyltransferase involved in cell wall biosynthesis